MCSVGPPHRFEDMNDTTASPPSSGDSGPVERTQPPWLIIVSLASLFLLWPLTGLFGFDSGTPRALLIVGVTAAAWIGVVGFGAVPRPVLALTLTGIAYGLLGAIVSLFFGGRGGALWTIFPALAINALWGCLAGLLAAGLQRLRGVGRSRGLQRLRGVRR